MKKSQSYFFGRGHINQIFSQYLLEQLTDDLISIGDRYEKIFFANSLSMEDMLIFHVLNTRARSVLDRYATVTLNTGRLPKETLDFITQIQSYYQIRLEQINPDPINLKKHIEQYGENGFYQSFEARKACCAVRKTQVLKQFFSEKLKDTEGSKAWMTGQRQQQSITRSDLKWFETDDQYQLDKYNPLYLWSFDQTHSSTQALQIPYHPFYDRGYRSIGCDPCTRAVAAGETERAGRWWWENPEQKECGIHWVGGKIERINH
jgi:phosphoadenosine phosphosulfate reductase